jgi:hydrogenase expression/formation protein HypC
MCLAIPMRIVSIDGLDARCEAKGITRTVSLFLMQHEQLGPGDIVVVHVGYALQKVSEDAARATWELLETPFDAGEPTEASRGPGGESA